MVLEALINPIRARKEPWEAFLIGIVYSCAAVIISLLLFERDASIVMISLTAMVSVPLIYGAIKQEEKKDLEITDKKLLIKEHGKVLLFFVFLFFGFVVSMSSWYIFLPDHVKENLFQVQINTIKEINSPVTGNVISVSSAILKVFFNNARVMAFCFLFTLFYGFGAIFILAWNASVIAAVIGDAIRSNTGSYLLAPLVLLKYSLHGIPEITAYFMAGLAGGIISIAVVRHDFGTKKFMNILVDSLDLTIGALILLAIGALVEVFISPMVL